MAMFKIFKVDIKTVFIIIFHYLMHGVKIENTERKVDS